MEKMGAMMNGGCTMCDWMMAGLGLFGVLGAIALVLGIAALVKYLRSGRK